MIRASISASSSLRWIFAGKFLSYERKFTPMMITAHSRLTNYGNTRIMYAIHFTHYTIIYNTIWDTIYNKGVGGNLGPTSRLLHHDGVTSANLWQ